MANTSVLGLFHEATPTADAVDGLRQLGVPDEQITIMSGIPYREEMLGRPREPRPVGLIALVGAVIGLVAGLFLSVGIFLLYPLHQGGQPVVPIPPSLIIIFETTMLGTMWAAFFGLLGASRFPAMKAEAYDPRITEGHIGILATVPAAQVEEVASLLQANGAHHMRREPVDLTPDVGRRRFWFAVGGALLLVTVIVLLLAYDVVEIPFPTQMDSQPSVAYLEGPRRAAPAAAVPVQGPALIAGEPASEPVPAGGASLQRGAVLFGINCALCHGEQGHGDGPLAPFFDPAPANLAGEEVQSLSDDAIFLVISEGRGIMPAIRENLSPEERWDVINHVRTFAEGSEE
jgi:mono/diheme cytochrome c family protein